MAVPSARPGMGAVPYSGGVTFRVWAPFATGVAVAGEFNGWSDSMHPLAPEGSTGNWSADVPLAVAQQQYRYAVRGAGGVLSPWRIDPRARAVTNSAGNGIIYDSGGFNWDPAVFGMPTWNDLVIYEMHIGSFNDPDPHSRPAGNPGTFDTALAKLPYLQDLGINAVQLMPIGEFPGDINMGYDVANPFAVESAYGGPDGLKRFINAAHGHGIAVILDVVYNHFGPTTDLGFSLWQFDGWSENGKGGIYFYEDWRSNTSWGDTRPDFGRDPVRQYIRDNAEMWREEFRCDGLRIDSTSYIRNVYGNNDDPADDLPQGWSLIQWLNEEVQQREPWKITIAEDMRNNPWITKSVGEGGMGCSAQWDAEFVGVLRGAMVRADDQMRDANAVADAITFTYNGDAFQRVVYTESHDEAKRGEDRLPMAISPEQPDSYWGIKRSTLAAAAVLTSPGIPLLLQGQEFLEDGYFSDDNPVDWSELGRFGGIHDLYRDLIRLRRNWFNNTRGLRGQYVNVFSAGAEDKVIAYHRWSEGGPGDDVVVVLNMRNVTYTSYTIGFPRSGTWYVRFNSDWGGYDSSFGNTPSYDTYAAGGKYQGMPYSGSVGLGPYTAILLSQ